MNAAAKGDVLGRPGRTFVIAILVSVGMSIRSVANRLVCGRYRRSIAAAVLVCMLSVIAGEAAIACTNTTVPSGNITYAYDVNGRLTGVVNASGRAATYVYDAVGNVTSIANPTNGSSATVDFSTPTTIVITISALSCPTPCSVPVSVTWPSGSDSNHFTLD